MSIVSDFSAISNHLREIEKQPEAKPACIVCDDGGFEMYSTGYMDPHFRECPICGNPEGHPSP